uniref:DUF3822 family protein n=4 Tax=unclassified Prevotella TaxID=2638335 RepID=A0AB33JGZ9_9BACT
MLETGNNHPNVTGRVTLRITRHSLSIAVVDAKATDKLVYEPYIMRSGISTAANLREAFRENAILEQGYRKAQVMIGTPVLMIPLEEFREESMESLYHYTFMNSDNDCVLHSVLPVINAVALYSINKDLKLVLDDHFADIRYMPIVQPMWSYLYRRSQTGAWRKLYGYFHDGSLDVFSFAQGRFKFCNSFDAGNSRDSAYFLLYAWQQMGFDVRSDELLLMGGIPDQDDLLSNLRRYLQKVHVMTASAEFNRAPITKIKGIPLDMAVLFLKGR